MKKLVLAMAVVFVLALGCASLSDNYLGSNIRISTYRMDVQGMTYIKGYSTSVGNLWGIQAIGKMAANDAAAHGWHDITVLVEMVSQGQPGGKMANGYTNPGSLSTVSVSFWR